MEEVDGCAFDILSIISRHISCVQVLGSWRHKFILTATVGMALSDQNYTLTDFPKADFTTQDFDNQTYLCQAEKFC